ncbi:MAG: hypothetical protein IPK10_17450 [Bacteroidetes bacterium]|nr:hypothetical protein [Bacteroidota bacterium]
MCNFFWKIRIGKEKFKVNPHSGLPEELVLPHNNHLSFVCNGIYLTAPDEVKLRYFLEEVMNRGRLQLRM